VFFYYWYWKEHVIASGGRHDRSAAIALNTDEPNSEAPRAAKRRHCHSLPLNDVSTSPALPYNYKQKFA
jgi:hypothetical protein